MWKYVNICGGIKCCNIHLNWLIILKLAFKGFLYQVHALLKTFSMKGLFLLPGNWDKVRTREEIKILFLWFWPFLQKPKHFLIWSRSMI